MTKDDLMTDLINLAFDNGVTITFDKLHSHTPPATNAAEKLIFMNSNWHRPDELLFQFAHELGHIMCNHKTTEILYFTPSKKGMELEANIFAINLLLPYYLEDKDPNYINIEQFMDCFSIPTYLYNIV
ncbi:ImmA/IrrE family metallo-endopeptidase, partial [Lactobacillus sp. XV13L]|nr:ImmA/IrrE family metallo-endopeptidase [Lactobacillus sp. XV13L]